MSKHSEVFVLGSGTSISQLTDSEIQHINQAKCRLAINKFMAFYKEAKILPTHVYFVDKHEQCNRFLQHIFDVCIADGLKDVTFVVNKELEKNITFYNAYKAISPFLEAVSFRQKRTLRQRLGIVYRLLRGRYQKTMYLVPRHCCFEFVNVDQSKWLEGGSWATNLQEPLFHFRTSLTSALNYISIVYPNTVIKFVGVDLNCGEYFFQKEIDALTFTWQDWTTQIVKEAGQHFAVQEYKGRTLFDKFDFVCESLGNSGNELVSCNPNSLLVEKGFMPYRPVME